MKNSTDLGECYPPRPSASVDNTLLDLQNSSYLTQPHSIIAKYTIISKYGERTRQLKFKKELRNFPSRNNSGWRKFAPLLNEQEVIELLENATSGSIRKATKYGMKIFQGKNLKTF